MSLSVYAQSVEPCELDLTLAPVALQGYGVQLVFLHQSFKDSVSFLSSVVRRDFCSAFGAVEIAFPYDILHINSKQLIRLQDTIPPLLSFASAEPKMFAEQCYSDSFRLVVAFFSDSSSCKSR